MAHFHFAGFSLNQLAAPQRGSRVVFPPWPQFAIRHSDFVIPCSLGAWESLSADVTPLLRRGLDATVRHSPFGIRYFKSAPAAQRAHKTPHKNVALNPIRFIGNGFVYGATHSCRGRTSRALFSVRGIRPESVVATGRGFYSGVAWRGEMNRSASGSTDRRSVRTTSVAGVFAVVGLTEFRRHKLFAPNLLARPLRMRPEVPVALLKVAVDCRFAGVH